MRLIKFKGIRKDNGKWVYGYLSAVKHTVCESPAKELLYIGEGRSDSHFVMPSTIGQAIGKKDNNDKEIYEGDIIRVYNWGAKTSNDILGVTDVVWSNDDCGWRYANNSEDLAEDFYDQFRNVKIIGNIHENPELIEQN